MRILHTSDWHLGIKFKNTNLIEAQKQFLSSLINVAKEKEVDVVVIAGDIFDNSISSSDAIELYSATITEFARLNKKVIIVAGNHDGAERLASLNKILELNGIFIRGNFAESLSPIVVNGVNFYAIHYFNKDEVNALFKTNADDMNDAYKILLENLAIDKQKINILISHIFARNTIVSDSETSSYVGGSSQVDAKMFCDFNYVALGHLHHRQKVTNNVYYSGAPLKYSFGDFGEQGAILIDISTKTEISLLDIKTDFDMLTLKGTKADLLLQAIQTPSNAFVRLIFNDIFVDHETQRLFKQYYPNLMMISGLDSVGDEGILTIEQMDKLTPIELARQYLNINARRDMTSEEEEFLTDAISKATMEERQ